MMKYELWQTEDEPGKVESYSFFPENNESARQLLEPNAKLIWTAEAGSFNEACSRRNEFLAWEPCTND